MRTADLLDGVISAATEAAGFIAAERENFNYEAVEHKGLNDLVSYVDKEAEKMIVKRLSDLFPAAGFIAEEETVSKKGEYNWIIDPLDGTTNFIHGLPDYAVSIALEHNSEITLGVVYEVSRNECFSAVRGGGAFLNEQKIKASQRKSLAEALVGTGFPVSNFERMPGYLKALEHFMHHTHGVRRMGAAATDLCYVACGRLDAFFEYNLKPWDVAAGGLIVTEAGGTVHDFSGGTNWLFGKEIACTNGLLQKDFLNAISGFLR